MLIPLGVGGVVFVFIALSQINREINRLKDRIGVLEAKLSKFPPKTNT